MNRLFKRLKDCDNELAVQAIYREELRKKFKIPYLKSPHRTDGLLYNNDEDRKKGKIVKCLLEFKNDMDFLNIKERSKVLCQVIYYLKKFEIKGEELPNVVFVGDKNECFVVSVFKLVKYLQWNLNWSLPASKAYSKNPDLIKAMIEDNSLNSFVINMENDDFKDIKLMIESNAEGLTFKKTICLSNIVQEFEYFSTKIWKQQKDENLDSNKLANIFMSLIDDPDNIALVKNKLWTNYGNIIVNRKECIIFKNRIKEIHPDDKLEIETNYNILLSDCDRRSSGEYPTPLPLVEDSHKIMDEYIEGDWKNDYLVVDPAWGRGNLTRDCDIENLQPMTLHQSDIDKAKELGILGAEDAVKFDFLNDGIMMHIYEQNNASKYLPKKLVSALENNDKIIFYMNPPFGDETTGSLTKLSDKGKIKNFLETGIKSYIIGYDPPLKRDLNELYIQFLSRIIILKEQYKLKNLYISFFSPLGFITGDKFSNFRKWFLSNFKYIKGVHYKAGEFSCTEDTWGIGFSIWKSCIKKDNKSNIFIFEDRRYDLDKKIFETYRCFNYWNLDYCIEMFRDWIKSNDNIIEWIYFPRMIKCGILREDEQSRIPKNFIGIGFRLGNAVGRNLNIPKLYSAPYSKNDTNIYITYENIIRILSGFTAKVIASSNKKDEAITQRFQLSKPNEQHPKYKQWNIDSIIYSIFNDRCETYSMRNYKCQGRRWDVKNEFFWLPKSYIEELLKERPYEKLYRDLHNPITQERYIAKLLFCKDVNGIKTIDKLSPDAYEVFEMGTNLFDLSFEIRKEYEENNLQSWDCGYNQLKEIWHDHFPEEFKAFRNKYKEMEARMRMLVYELGFLKGEPL